ncbi:lasso peptide biosynthesis B2 protein [Phenylobacterium koreense]|uniref:Microcin J25-processing protein McjB C-terminal domain-containing protein n=1 Tax=Phenylobacterium koreense TaxID=266125 RepID=A0ABV2ENK9_9CAUL
MPLAARQRPRREAHAVAIGDDLVILDLGRNLYMCVPGAAKAWLSPDGASPDIAKLFTLAGLDIGDAPDERGPYSPPAKPWADVGEDLEAAISWRDLAQAAIATVDLWLNYRGRSLAQLIARIEQGRPRQGRTIDPNAAHALARRFQAWIALAPVSDKCLVRSFMLLRYLQRNRLGGTWVFGVRTWPFRAHCWVQLGPVALDDAHERLIAYTPILAVSAQ